MGTLIYFLVWAGLIYLMLRFGCGAHVMGHARHRGGSTASPTRRNDLRWLPPETDVDPVCGKTIRPKDAKPSVYEGLVYYFCSRECRERFEAAPHLYVESQADAQPKQLDHAHG